MRFLLVLMVNQVLFHPNLVKDSTTVHDKLRMRPRFTQVGEIIEQILCFWILFGCETFVREVFGVENCTYNLE